jgi:Ser/Thr protein kinase RdoA (MazF antagonist)
LIVERELGLGPDSVQRIEEGLLHETYAITCGGTQYVLQFTGREPDKRDSLRRGAECYELLSDSEIPVPRVVAAEWTQPDTRGYLLVEKLPGKSATLEISPEKVRTAGRTLARIHTVRTFERAGWLTVDGDGLSVRPFDDGPRGRRREQLRRGVQVLVAEGLETAGRAVECVLGEGNVYFPSVTRPVLCHDDFSPDNLLFRDGAVTGVLDFDRAYAGHAQRDLVHSASAFWMHDPGVDWAVRDAFYEGYREHSDLGSSFAEIEPLYRIETLVSLVVGMLDATGLSEYEREFYDERIREAVERLNR